ncbi:VCBS repeat-containing protein [Streptomyces sp. NBC_00094]|uniref:FG-GAP repeat domain-containing protein n=1 Tax=Streptomyces sp. NBC_00094 TaxID=2903620 RepID=UPI0022570FDF|nr:VCBS repeat-containing protein [Streptomyces sp. NBC_00094]MCX5392451.1 VCBS repeat-containing protein [Streptomyces sp. NBC_00094]
MTSVRSTRRRLSASVATVLAVTLGAGALAVPAASAAPLPAGVTAQTAQTADVVAYPGAATIIASGTTGFLSYDKAIPEYRWTPYDGSAPTALPGRVPTTGALDGDLVVSVEADKATLRDMKTGATVLGITLGTIDGPGGVGGATIAFGGVAGTAVFSTVTTDNGVALVRHRKDAGPATVTGLPAGAKAISVRPGTAEHALVTYTTSAGARHRALLDLATASVTETYETPKAAEYGDVAVSATRIAWVEYDTATHTARAVVRTRGGDANAADTLVPLGETWMVGAVELGLVGDWLTSSQRGGLDSVEPSPLHALTAHSLTSTEKFPLLDHITSAVATADGGQLVRGGRIADGEGLYRIALGQDAKPAAEFVATAGQTTGLAFVKPAGVPVTADLDRYRGNVDFRWYLNRWNVDFKATLRHVRTGKSISMSQIQATNGVAWFGWKGDLSSGNGTGPDLSAYNGEYTWEVTAKPLSGIGAPVTAKGTFTVTRKAHPHDFDDNGSPDLLSRDTSGVLWRDSTFDNPYTKQISSQQTRIGAGWGIYNRIEATGNIAGSTVGDLVARDAAGVLWLYQGDGRGSFTGRTRIGGGWQVYDQLAGGSDLTGDGRADLVATDKAGVMYLYKGTGSVSAPYATRQKVGAGWAIYNQITVTGNIAGTAPGDLVARDKAGVLWLYQGDGRGSFGTRTKIGGGWNALSDIVGAGDADRDGTPDLLTRSAVNKHVYHYRGTGVASAPFYGPEITSLDSTKAYNLFS